MEKTLLVDSSKCAGCRICEQWCAFTHGKYVNEDNSRIRVVKDHKNFTNIPLVCHQCGNPICVNSCPTKALAKDETTGAILLNKELCIGCRKCVRLCPYGAIHYVANTKTVTICDLCGGNPQCVSRCPMDAIMYLDTDAAEDNFREDIARKMGGQNNE